MHHSLYSELVSWYPLLDPVDDHRDEAAAYEAGFAAAAPRAETLLELGSGAGNNACHLKRRYRCTLTDPSAPMLALSRSQNPECEHLQGDMRSVRLGRTFDVVLVHDAVMYMTTEAELLAAIRTARVHTAAGGAAIFAPDCLRENFREGAELVGGQSGPRALRGLHWSWDPDEDDTQYLVDYALLLRDGHDVRSVHERHVEGVFPGTTWERLLASVGFHTERIPRPITDGESDEVFVCRPQ